MTSRPDTLRVRSRRGYSLIEVMIASMVLMLVFISCITALQAGFRMVDNARMANLANQTIQSQIETVKLLGWSYIDGIPPTSTWYFQSQPFTSNLALAPTDADGFIDFFDYIPSVVGNVDSNQLKRITAFRMKVEDSEDPGGASRPEVKRILVELQWSGLKGNQTFTRRFETFISR